MKLSLTLAIHCDVFLPIPTVCCSGCDSHGSTGIGTWLTWLCRLPVGNYLMQAKKRYALLASSVIGFIFLLLLLWRMLPHYRMQSISKQTRISYSDFESFLDWNELKFDSDLFGPRSKYSRSISADDSIDIGQCTMAKCFDFERCVNRSFKVHIYPLPDSQSRLPVVSESYAKILSAITHSSYYTANASDACLFVLSYDTLDRDIHSENYLRGLQRFLHMLPMDLWNDGRNHVIFSLFSGTWPDYRETELNFNPEFAILAKASFSISNFRSGFDISLPLFQRSVPAVGSPGDVDSTTLLLPVKDKYLLSFKGKRYVYGIGSETRNSLYHLHLPQRSLVMLTTCIHGKNWQQLKDARCEEDNANYEKWDYEDLLSNSTFCLIPRGRRLGSFRFLEALRFGCIPVLLSNQWRLPFSEVIDWTKVVVWADERFLFQVPDLIRFISPERILAMKQQAQLIYRLYLSSVEKIVWTSLEIIRDRIHRWKARSSIVWNRNPVGALHHSADYANDLSLLPFYHHVLPLDVRSKFTAVVSVKHPQKLYNQSAFTHSSLHSLMTNLEMSGCGQIILLWAVIDEQLPSRYFQLWSNQSSIALELIDVRFQKAVMPQVVDQIARFNAIFVVDARVPLTPELIKFALSVWHWFPDRLVGFFPAAHSWNALSQRWQYDSLPSDRFSLLTSNALVYHRYFNHIFLHNSKSAMLLRELHSHPECEDILLNFLVAQLLRKSPILLSASHFDAAFRRSLNSAMLELREGCLNRFCEIFSGMPLQFSKFQLTSNSNYTLFHYKTSISNRFGG